MGISIPAHQREPDTYFAPNQPSSTNGFCCGIHNADAGLVMKVRPVTVSPALVGSFAPPTADHVVGGVQTLHALFWSQSTDALTDLQREALLGLYSNDLQWNNL